MIELSFYLNRFYYLVLLIYVFDPSCIKLETYFFKELKLSFRNIVWTECKTSLMTLVGTASEITELHGKNTNGYHRTRERNGERMRVCACGVVRGFLVASVNELVSDCSVFTALVATEFLARITGFKRRRTFSSRLFFTVFLFRLLLPLPPRPAHHRRVLFSSIR